MAPKLKEIKVNLPWLPVEMTWGVDQAQRLAAWEVYVELITRISVEPLGEKDGVLREALTSLYSLFGETRRILRAHGPDIAIPEKKKYISLGQLAVDVLNVVLRPFLAKWHKLLKDYEAQPHPGVTDVQHESSWPLDAEFRDALEKVRTCLELYADVLALACETPALHRRPQLVSGG